MDKFAPSLTNIENVDSQFPLMLRYAAYTLLIFSATTSLPLILQQSGISAFKEGGCVELCQLLLLALTAGIYFYSALPGSHHQGIFHLLGCISLFAFIRELDSFFDKIIPLIGWKFGWAVLLYGLFCAYSHRKVFRCQLRRFMTTHAIGILWAGFLVAVPIGQLVGHGEFLQALMGDDYTRDYKRVIEESMELIGYILLLAGSIEAKMELAAKEKSLSLLPPRHGTANGKSG